MLARAVASKWFSKYPFFFVYLAFVFLQEVFLIGIYLYKPKYYPTSYWYGEFFSLAMGCGVVWEIFRLVLGRYPGAGRMARNVLLFALIMVFTKALDNAWNGSAPWPSTALALERNLRALQGLSLVVLAALCAYYAIPLGRNVKGLFIGYGLFVATTMMTLTLRTWLGGKFQAAWVFLQPFFYAGVLGIWCAALWKYEPGPLPEAQPKLEVDYQSLAFATKKKLHQARALLGKATRP